MFHQKLDRKIDQKRLTKPDIVIENSQLFNFIFQKYKIIILIIFEKINIMMIVLIIRIIENDHYFYRIKYIIYLE